jgi:hypothetical protein
MQDNYDIVGTPTNYSPENIQSVCAKIGDAGCLICVYLRAGGIDLIRAITDYNRLVAQKIIDINCKVLDADKLFIYFHRFATVTKSDNPPEDKNTLYAANYVFSGKNHWVLCKGDDVIYSSLAYSHCLACGSPKDYRIINITK